LSCGVFPSETKGESGGKVVLDEKFSKELAEGGGFDKILEYVAQKRNSHTQKAPIIPESLKKTVTNKVDKMNNWKAIHKTVNAMNCGGLDDDTLGLITMGDTDLIGELLGEMRRFVMGFDGKPASSKGLTASKVKKGDQSIDLNEVNASMELSESGNMLELAIVSLCRHLNLKSKQAAGLLANNNR